MIPGFLTALIRKTGLPGTLRGRWVETDGGEGWRQVGKHPFRPLSIF